MLSETDRDVLKQSPVGRLALQVIRGLEKQVQDFRYRYQLANERAQMSPADDTSWVRVKGALIEMSVEDLRKLQRMDVPRWSLRQQMKHLATHELNRRGQL